MLIIIFFQKKHNIYEVNLYVLISILSSVIYFITISLHSLQRIAYANRDKQREDWNDGKLGIMEELLRLKLEQNPYVKKKLLQTKDYLIVEDSPKDSFWGWGPNRDGENQLGKLWMKLRDELKDKK